MNNFSKSPKGNRFFLSSLIQWLGKPLETFLTKEYSDNVLDIFPPVFIIGSPRTGSTIFYLLVTNFWDVPFINNFHCVFYNTPIFGALLSKIFFSGRSNKNYKSKHGNTKGLRGPSECGRFWYNWFPRSRHYVAKKELSQKDIRDIRKTVDTIVSIFQGPLFFKNLNCGQRVGALSDVFPEAFFVYFKRNPLFVAQSLLLSRERIYGDRETWWSVMPKEYPQISDHEPERQVVEQVYYIEKQIEQDLARYYPGRHYELKYEELVDKPIQQLESLKQFFREKGLEIDSSGYSEMPLMENRNFQRVDDQTFSKLIDLVEEIYD